jgi:hypothetical protein
MQLLGEERRLGRQAAATGSLNFGITFSPKARTPRM